MREAKKIINLTEKINSELEHFIPCVNSEMHAKSAIYKYLRQIRSLVKKNRSRVLSGNGRVSPP
jgi:hypothetical protein